MLFTFHILMWIYGVTRNCYFFVNVCAKTKQLLHRTFRIPEEVVISLEKEANSRGVPLSNLVNKILKNHLTTGLHNEKASFVLTSKDFFRRVFGKIDERSIEDFGKELAPAKSGSCH